jgi:hypothetical protein
LHSSPEINYRSDKSLPLRPNTNLNGILSSKTSEPDVESKTPVSLFQDVQALRYKFDNSDDRSVLSEPNESNTSESGETIRTLEHDEIDYALSSTTKEIKKAKALVKIPLFIKYTCPYATALDQSPYYKRKGIHFKEQGFFKPHADLAFDRLVAEASNLNYAYSVFQDNFTMVDVGGSPNRWDLHSQLFEKIVYLCPTFDAADVLRSTNRKECDEYVVLDCPLQRFRTQEPHFLNFTQSLYYIGIEGLFQYMASNRSCQMAFATVHIFADTENGDIFGQATYSNIGNHVRMHVKNTNKVYNHPSLAELFTKNGYTAEFEGNVYTLVWDYSDHTEVTAMFRFVLKMGNYAISEVTAVTRDQHFEIQNVHGCGLTFSVNGRKFRKIPVIESYISEKAQFIDRNVTNLATVVRSILREKPTLITTYGSENVKANAAFFFYQTADMDSNLIVNLTGEYRYSVFNLNRLLRDKFSYNIDLKNLYETFTHPLALIFSFQIKMLLIIDSYYGGNKLAMVINAVLILPKIILNLFVNILHYLQEAVGQSKWQDVIGRKPADSIIATDKGDPDGSFTLIYLLINVLGILAPLYLLYIINRNHYPIYTKFINGIKSAWLVNNYHEIPSTHEPTYSTDSNMKRSDAIYLHRNDPSMKEEKEKPLYPLLGNINGYTPNNTSGSTTFTEAAIKMRWVEPSPHENNSQQMWSETLSTVAHLVKSVFIEPLNEITPSMFDSWISRFTGLKLKMLNKALEDIGILNKAEIDHAGWKAFIKREKLYKTMEDEIKPRGIVHAQPVYNAFFGPWFFHMYKRFKKFIVDAKMPITIASGINRSELSKIFNEAYSKGYDKIYENDFTQFEKTHSSSAYGLEALFYTAAGMPASLIRNYVNLHSRTKAKTNKYSAFDVDFARFSGDQTTSLGNSMVNAFVTYVILLLMGLKPSDFHLFILGDDLLILSRCKIDIVKMSLYYSYHGFKSKLFERNIYNATFLSMNFMKCEDGLYRAFPKIGKFILSRSHCTSHMAQNNPNAVLKSNFLSEQNYLRGHPILGPFVNSVLTGLVGWRVPLSIANEITEMLKYRLILAGDRGYDSEVDINFMNEYMFENYGIDNKGWKDIQFDLRFLGYDRNGIDSPHIKTIFDCEGL